jgi:hypothetical protein
VCVVVVSKFFGHEKACRLGERETRYRSPLWLLQVPDEWVLAATLQQVMAASSEFTFMVSFFPERTVIDAHTT